MEEIKMSNLKKSINNLQVVITGLAKNLLAHEVQGKIFISQGFEKLGERYLEHADEERKWVSKAVDLILDLDGEVKLETLELVNYTQTQLNI